ncbi:MAG: sugar ABC transporter ATP-binding protein [Anaerolineaceae bacterium]|nr:MAG: sugar ABC transporter ATP-binding protein [Anaerolineaceae bacterium]
MSSPLLELKNINLAVSSFKIHDINISLYPGEVHIVMGENGSGKSKLLELISGMILPDSGDIYFEGELIKPNKPSLYSSNDLIFIQQYSVLLEDLSVAENLYFHQLPYKNKFLHTIDFVKLNKQFLDLINELNLPIKANDTVRTLGLAQRQMIEFTKAYISDAKVVILDEPSDVLTASEREILYKIINHIKERGAGIFYTTHRIEDAMTIGDRISIIKDGTLTGTKVIKETTEQEIIHLLTGTHLKERYPKMIIKKGKPLLTVSNLSYEDKLTNINFKLREGEILGITGLAGSGRTLLANCLFGVTNYSGQIYIYDKPVNISSPRKAINYGIALMPENHIEDSIFRELSADENVAFPSLHRFSRNDVINYDYLKQTVLDYIAKINIPVLNKKSILEYSGGSLQKAIFAKWMMSRAKIFILDEPTRGIDIASKIDIYNFISDMAKKKAGIIYISSDIDEIMGICDRVAVISANTLVCDLPTHLTTAEEVTGLQVRNISNTGYTNPI